MLTTSQKEKRDFYTRAFLATLPAVTNALFIGKALPAVPDPYDDENGPEDEKAWDNAREIGDAIARFTSLIASRAAMHWEEQTAFQALDDAKALFREASGGDKDAALKLFRSIFGEDGDGTGDGAP
jgi:hypothetical protein